MQSRPIGAGIVLAATIACSGPSFELPDLPKQAEPAAPSARLRELVGWRLSPQDAEQILTRTRMFVVGEPSRQIQAFNVTFEQSDARRRFLLVAGRAQLAGQLYALCALRTLDVREASQLKSRLEEVTGAVAVFDHGVASERLVADMTRIVQAPSLLAGLRQFKAP